MGGIRDSVAGRRVTSAFMSLSNSSSWFRTGARATEKEGQEKDRERKRWSQEKRRGVGWTDKVRKREREDTDVKGPEKKKITEVDRKREQLGGWWVGVSGKERERPDHHRERWREKKGKGNMEKREIEEDIGRHGGGELSEHPILEE